MPPDQGCIIVAQEPLVVEAKRQVRRCNSHCVPADGSRTLFPTQEGYVNNSHGTDPIVLHRLGPRVSQPILQ